jgi:hypothetical protein
MRVRQNRMLKIAAGARQIACKQRSYAFGRSGWWSIVPAQSAATIL